MVWILSSGVGSPKAVIFLDLIRFDFWSGSGTPSLYSLSLEKWSADANGGTLESLGYKEGFRVDVDIPDGTWAEAPSFHDILIFNTGHW
ncbi:unnamed protein product, partial [Vitis vinifera]